MSTPKTAKAETVTRVPASPLALLREPFPAHQIAKLPKQVKRDDQDKGRCERGSRYSADGYFCGGWHARSMHLDYVGHAALTDRLLDVDPEWSWEPVAFGDDGLPKFDHLGGLWIRLTVCGVTRLGYGDSQGKSGPNAVKEAIGDALRNAAMRFGAALDLWHKGDLHADDNEAPTQYSEDPDEYIDLIADASTIAELSAAGARISASHVSGAARDDLRARYSQRLAELNEAAGQQQTEWATAESAVA